MNHNFKIVGVLIDDRKMYHYIYELEQDVTIGDKVLVTMTRKKEDVQSVMRHLYEGVIADITTPDEYYYDYPIHELDFVVANITTQAEGYCRRRYARNEDDTKYRINNEEILNKNIAAFIKHLSEEQLVNMSIGLPTGNARLDAMIDTKRSQQRLKEN